MCPSKKHLAYQYKIKSFITNKRRSNTLFYFINMKISNKISQRIFIGNIFFNYYFPVPRPSMDHSQEASLTKPMLITAFLSDIGLKMYLDYSNLKLICSAWKPKASRAIIKKHFFRYIITPSKGRNTIRSTIRFINAMNQGWQHFCILIFPEFWLFSSTFSRSLMKKVCFSLIIWRIFDKKCDFVNFFKSEF